MKNFLRNFFVSVKMRTTSSSGSKNIFQLVGIGFGDSIALPSKLVQRKIFGSPIEIFPQPFCVPIW
jgi:hypothetical protein